MKMENYSKAIDEAIKKIDWDIVKQFYESKEYTSLRKGKFSDKPKSIHEVKKELKDLINFAIECNTKELRHEQWIVLWNEDFARGTFKLEVFFTISRTTITEEPAHDEEEELNSDQIEKEVLEDMLKKSIQEENYELSAVIHSRLKKLEKILKRS